MYEQVSVSAQKKESGELSILLREFGLHEINHLK